jgi:hypothetical protein
MSKQAVYYNRQEDDSPIHVCFHEDTFWLTLESMSKLFGVETRLVFETLKDILKSGSLDAKSVNKKLTLYSEDGNPYLVNFFNLDVIMAIGYRLNIYEATEFRNWTIYMTKTYLLQGVRVQHSVIGSLKRKLKRVHKINP